MVILVLICTRTLAANKSLLTEVAEVADPDDLAKQMFKAKSKMLSTLSSHALIRGDNKTFCFKSAAGVETKIAFGAIRVIQSRVLFISKPSK